MYEETLTVDRLIQIIQDYVGNDAECADADYIRTKLLDTCGCSMEEIRALGLDWLFPDDDMYGDWLKEDAEEEP